MATKQELLAKADVLRKRLDKGQIKGKVKRFRAQKYIAHLKWMSKQDEKSSKKKTRGSVRRPKKQNFNPDQGVLPNFLKQMSLVRIEELVAEKVFRKILGEKSDQQIIQEVNEVVNKTIAKVLPVKVRVVDTTKKSKKRKSA